MNESRPNVRYIDKRLLVIIDECTGQLREHYGLGHIVSPVGVAQALCETVAELTGKRYEMTDEGVVFL